MPDLAINEALLGRLAARNNFDMPEEDDLVFFGIRGALPTDIGGTPFAKTHGLRLTDINNVQMRCTIGQYRPKTGELAVFPGSTVPSVGNVRAARAQAGIGANMLMLGRYRYERGIHKAGRPSGHRAFRQAVFFPVWRTSDDLDYDLADMADLDGDLVWDNLHSAYHDNLDTAGFSSAGCQVVCGHPRSAARGNRPETGPWKRFIENSYDAPGGQRKYVYLLFSGAEVSMVATKPADQIRQSVRFGSSGALVKEVQTALLDKGFDLGIADGDFARTTIEALMAFQTREFGRGKADGVVGPNTAAALGVDLPTLADAEPDVPVADLDVRVSIDALDKLADKDEAPHDIAVKLDGKDWSAAVDGGKAFYVGTSVKWSSYQGIYQPAGKLGDLPGGKYEAADWAAGLGKKKGAWAWFLLPTIMGESSGLFGRINTYDGAGLTFGILQLASHTPDDNLILLFRRLLALDDAKRWFPDLTLVGGQVHRRMPTGTASLERIAANGRLADFMAYLNPDATTVSEVEVANAARLLGWALASKEVAQAQIDLGIQRFGQRVNRLGTKYGVDLAKQPVSRLIWVADILHHGRGTYRAIREAIQSGTPDKALAKIGGGNPRWAERIQTVKAQIAAVEPKLGGETWGKGAFAV
jgi:peptidoglycan hydrolase-like protein with peptidoglycan-binding domain